MAKKTNQKNQKKNNSAAASAPSTPPPEEQTPIEADVENAPDVVETVLDTAVDAVVHAIEEVVQIPAAVENVPEPKAAEPVKAEVVVPAVPKKEVIAEPPAITTQETAAPADDSPVIADEADIQDPEYFEDKVNELQETVYFEEVAPCTNEYKYSDKVDTQLESLKVSKDALNRANLHELFKDKEYDYPIWHRKGVKDGVFPEKKKCCACC